jgi:Acyl-CoA dehydrogenase, C-terminal domain
VGVALATVEAATAHLERVVTDAWAVVVAGGRLDWVQRGKLGLGGTHAAQLSMQAIEHLYTIGGATAVYAASEFDRCLRDARTAVQHTMTPFVHYEIPGKQFVGLDNRDFSWAFDDRGDAG